jgi:hypothetical protein
MFLANRDELLHTDLAIFACFVEEQQHGCVRVDSSFEFLAAFYLDETDAAVSNHVVIRKAMGLLDDDLGFHPSEVGDAADAIGVLAGKYGRCTQRQSGGCARWDHCRGRAQHLRDPLPYCIMQFIQADEFST